MNIRIGIDLRGVLAKPEPEKNIVCSTKDYAEAMVMENALEVLKNFKTNHGADIFIITCMSKPKMAMAAGQWLERNQVFQQLGIAIKNLHICSAREEKAKIAQKLNLTHFVDDRFSVLIHFPKTIKTFCFSPQEEKLENFPNFSSTIATSWIDIEKDILS